MNLKSKKKLCWNCEGRVGFTEEHCPFCGVYLSPSTTTIAPEERESNYTVSGYSPPYNSNSPEARVNAPPPPYQHQSDDSLQSEALEQALPKESETMRSVVISLSTLLGGSVFFLFGLVLLLFSRNGNLVLQWSGEYWYIYLCGGIFMLLLGWRTVQQLDPEE